MGYKTWKVFISNRVYAEVDFENGRVRLVREGPLGKTLGPWHNVDDDLEDGYGLQGNKIGERERAPSG